MRCLNELCVTLVLTAQSVSHAACDAARLFGISVIQRIHKSSFEDFCSLAGVPVLLDACANDVGRFVRPFRCVRQKDRLLFVELTSESPPCGIISFPTLQQAAQYAHILQMCTKSMIAARGDGFVRADADFFDAIAQEVRKGTRDPEARHVMDCVASCCDQLKRYLPASTLSGAIPINAKPVHCVRNALLSGIDVVSLLVRVGLSAVSVKSSASASEVRRARRKIDRE
jgi:hypothetical protein